MLLSRTVTVIAALSAITVAVAVPAASAAQSHRATKTEKFVISGPEGHQLVVAHGAFVGGGKDAAHDAYDVLHLGGGTVRINHPESQSKFNYHVNPKTCFASITGHGKYTISNGTGKYKGVTGHGTYKIGFQDILAKKKDGSCNMDAKPKVEVGEITASGPVTT